MDVVPVRPGWTGAPVARWLDRSRVRPGRWTGVASVRRGWAEVALVQRFGRGVPGPNNERVESASAEAFARTEVAAVRDDPARRLALLRRLYEGGPGEQGRLPYRRAATAFMSWQLRRGLLNPPSAAEPGSPWWRA